MTYYCAYMWHPLSCWLIAAQISVASLYVTYYSDHILSFESTLYLYSAIQEVCLWHIAEITCIVIMSSSYRYADICRYLSHCCIVALQSAVSSGTALACIRYYK